MITEQQKDFSTVNGHGSCLICGNYNPMSLHLSFQADERGGVKTFFRGHSGLQGYSNILHGGVIASLLDSAMTHCLFHHEIKAVTGELSIRYLHPVPFSASLEIKAEITSVYAPLYKLRSEIYQGEVLMASAEAKFMQSA